MGNLQRVQILMTKLMEDLADSLGTVLIIGIPHQYITQIITFTKSPTRRAKNITTISFHTVFNTTQKQIIDYCNLYCLESDLKEINKFHTPQYTEGCEYRQLFLKYLNKDT